MQGLGNGLSGGPFQGGDARSAAYGTTQDGSGWVVNIGGTQNASASPVRTMTDPTPATQSAGYGGAFGLVAVAIFAVLILKVKK